MKSFWAWVRRLFGATASTFEQIQRAVADLQKRVAPYLPQAIEIVKSLNEQVKPILATLKDGGSPSDSAEATRKFLISVMSPYDPNVSVVETEATRLATGSKGAALLGVATFILIRLHPDAKLTVSLAQMIIEQAYQIYQLWESSKK